MQTADQAVAPGTLARDQLPKSRALSTEFESVRIAAILKWLKRLRIEPPFQVDGTVSGWLWAQAPRSGWFEISKYRVEGELRSPRLTIDHFFLTEAVTRFAFQNGNWTVTKAQGRLSGQRKEDPSAPPLDFGLASMTAQIPTAAASSIEVHGRLDNSSVENIMSFIPEARNVMEETATVTGHATLDFNFRTQLTSLASPEDWNAHGTLQSKDLQFSSLALRNAPFSPIDVAVDWHLGDRKFSGNGIVSIDGRRVQLAGQMQFAPQAQWQISLPRQTLQIIPQDARYLPEQAKRFLPTGTFEVQGTLVGTSTAASMEANLQLAAPSLFFMTRKLSTVNAHVELSDQRLTVQLDRVAFEHGSASGKFTVDLPAMATADVAGEFDSIEVADWNPNPQQTPLSGSLSGTLKADLSGKDVRSLQSWNGRLDGRSKKLDLNGFELEDVRIGVELIENSPELKFEIEEQGAEPRMKAGGTINLDLQGDQPFDLKMETSDTLHCDSVNVHLSRLSLKQLSHLTFVRKLLPEITAKKSWDGELSLTANLERSSSGNGQGSRAIWRGWHGTVQGFIEGLRLEQFDAGKFRFEAALNQDTWAAQSTGTLAGGDLSLEGNGSSIDSMPDVNAVHAKGSLRSADLGGLLAAVHTSSDRNIASSAAFSGSADLAFEIDRDASSGWTGTGDLHVPTLHLHNRTILRDLESELRVRGSHLEVTHFSSLIAQGKLSAQGEIALEDRQASSLVVDADNVMLEDVIGLVAPESVNAMRGTLNAHGTLERNGGLRFRGSAHLRHGRLFDAPVQEAHGDFVVQQMTSSSPITWSLANLRGTMFGGTMTVRASGHSGSGSTSLAADLRIQRGSTKELTQWTGTSSVIGTGTFHGELSIQADHLRGPQDLHGRLQIQFADADAQTLPLADPLARFIPLLGYASTEFDRGTLVGDISRGALRIQKLALTGKQLAVVGDGSVGLTTGRLDLQLVIQTVGGIGRQVAAAYLAEIAADAAAPLALLLEINRVVANRAVFLKVGGTASKPVIQPQAGRILGRILLQSLLEQALPVSAAIPQR
ncbi:MAG: AsmA-like C-terminal region-containing protein [Pirellulales bacterium]